MESGLKKQILGIVADLLEEMGLLTLEEKNCMKNVIEQEEVKRISKVVKHAD